MENRQTKAPRIARGLRATIGGALFSGAVAAGGPAVLGGAAAVTGVALAFRGAQQRRDHIWDLQQAVKQSYVEIDVMQSAKHETQLALAEAERQTSIWQGAQEEASRQAAAAQEAASQAQKQHAEQVQQLRHVVERLQEQMKGMEGKAGGLESQLTDFRNQVKEERRQAEEAHCTLVVEQEEQKAEIQRLGNDIALKAAAGSEQQAVVERLQEQMQDMEGKAGGLESQLANLSNQVKEERRQAEEAHRILMVEQEELKAEVQRLGGDITLKAAAASEQQAVMSRLQEQMGDSSASVLALSHDLSSTKETHSTALQALKSEVEQLKEQVRRSDEAAAATKAQVQHLQDKLECAESRLACVEQETATATAIQDKAVQAQDNDIQQLISMTAGLVEAVEQLCQQQQARGNIGQVGETVAGCNCHLLAGPGAGPIAAYHPQQDTPAAVEQKVTNTCAAAVAAAESKSSKAWKAVSTGSKIYEAEHTAARVLAPAGAVDDGAPVADLLPPAHDRKAASEKEASEKAEQARKEGAAKEAATAHKKKDEQAKAAKVKAEEGPASPSKGASAPPATSSSLSSKQKRKDMMKRAEEKDTAAGYEDRFQPKQPVAVEPSTPAARGGPQPASTEAESSGRSASGEVDDDDWEQTADHTPRGPNAPQGSAQASTSGRKAYTLDWMLRQQDQPECQSLPSHFEAANLIAMGWRSQMRPGQGGGFDWPPTRVPGGERGHPGMGGGGRGMGSGPVMPPPGVAFDKWQQQGPMAPMPGMDMRGGRGDPRGGMGGPGRGGPMGKPGGNMERDRWGKRALPPPPPGSGGGAIAGLPALHKTDNKFKIGQVEGDNPEEIKKQKAIKGSLNKITPENFEKILADIIAVGYETEATESGLIDQVFDKALTETTFCEIYADLCFRLNSALPSFEPPSQDATKRPPSTFRKQLLNKCQEEFEKGAAAMEAVEAREKAEQGKSKEEKEQDQAEAAEASGSEEEEEAPAEAATGEEEREEGEIVPPATPVDKKAQRLQARRAAAQAAADELKARQRALGNIQFIGYLYRKKMLTEKIMHKCIKKLLADVEAPKQEGLECLAKLMSTVGRQLDTAQAQMYMNTYFERVAMLRKNMSLESRIRFMLQDLTELRRNAWVARREVEGPKKIDQVHADARRDDANRARAAAGGPNMRGNRV